MVVNSLFPHRLGDHVGGHKMRAIQIATDCVYSGWKGFYSEDDSHDARYLMPELHESCHSRPCIRRGLNDI